MARSPRDGLSRVVLLAAATLSWGLKDENGQRLSSIVSVSNSYVGKAWLMQQILCGAATLNYFLQVSLPAMISCFLRVRGNPLNRNLDRCLDDESRRGVLWRSKSFSTKAPVRDSTNIETGNSATALPAITPEAGNASLPSSTQQPVGKTSGVVRTESQHPGSGQIDPEAADLVAWYEEAPEEVLAFIKGKAKRKPGYVLKRWCCKCKFQVDPKPSDCPKCQHTRCRQCNGMKP
ncbi:MAG: hypothetical protein Q9220_007724 [cf. Caloplaca sp. 1 TL-2023]